MIRKKYGIIQYNTDTRVIYIAIHLAMFLTRHLGDTCEDYLNLTITINITGSLADVIHRLD